MARRSWLVLLAAALLVAVSRASDDQTRAALLAQKAAITNWDEFARGNALLGWTPEVPDVCKWTGVLCREDGNFELYWTHRDALNAVAGWLLPPESSYVNSTVPQPFTVKAQGRLAPQLATLGLISLWMPYHNLTGPLPPEFGAPQALPNLTTIGLAGNRLTGPLPASWAAPGSLPKLETLDVSDNSIAGPLPSEWGASGSLPSLRTAVLQKNAINGSLPAWWGANGSLPLLEKLVLSTNRVTGPLPESWGSLRSFQDLRLLELANNSITGALPAAWADPARWPHLRELKLSFNNLTGPLPEAWAGAGALPDLEVLAATYTSLTSSLPRSWASNSSFLSLTTLQLGGNKFTGSIPEEWDTAFPQLELLTINNNPLCGPVPPSLVALVCAGEINIDGVKCQGNAIPCSGGNTTGAPPAPSPPAQQPPLPPGEPGSVMYWGETVAGLNEYVVDDFIVLESPIPTPLPGGLPFVSISAGSNHACGLLADGRAYCLGENWHGQLGVPRHATAEVPIQVTVFGSPAFTALAAGGRFTCGLLKGKHTAVCWGERYEYDARGEIDVDGTEPMVPVAGFNFSSIYAGTDHACGIQLGTGAAVCWGSDSHRQLGSGAPAPANGSDDSVAGLAGSNVGVKVAGGHSWAHLCAGYRHTCGVDTKGKAWCWGGGDYGALGNGRKPIAVSTPQPVASNLTFTQVGCSDLFSCALASDGTVSCWGHNRYGQLGDGSQKEDSAVPVRVAESQRFKQLAVGGTFTCGLATDEFTYCWGYLSSNEFLRTPSKVQGDHKFASLAAGSEWIFGLLPPPARRSAASSASASVHGAE